MDGFQLTGIQCMEAIPQTAHIMDDERPVVAQCFGFGLAVGAEAGEMVRELIRGPFYPIEEDPV
jgi:hypothetical protein